MNVLAVAVHPDDETLGCGATLLKHAAAGARLHWAILTSAQAPEFGPDRIVLQQAQVERVTAAYRFESVTWLRRPAARLETGPLGELVAALAGLLARVRPEVVFVPHWSDGHSDHRVAFDACLSALRPVTMSRLGVRRVLAMEVASQTDSGPPAVRPPFVPDVFVDVSATLERKLEIFSLYATEVDAGAGPRSLSSVRALARHRGAGFGVEYAEAFALVRELA